jgi:hypothetical protein
MQLIEVRIAIIAMIHISRSKITAICNDRNGLLSFKLYNYVSKQKGY